MARCIAGPHDKFKPPARTPDSSTGVVWQLIAFRLVTEGALDLGWHPRIRLGRDYYVRIDSKDYSVDPHAIGRFVDIHADLDRVRVRCAGRLVADHARVWARGTTVTDPAHVAAAKVLRQQFQTPRQVAGPDQDLVRDLADYDRAFGIIDGQVC